uniref:Uncharacterized protein n=1 Tax=Rhizophora mucronata TaxID=61149 RepID=A0A2P2ITY1_RHIMU
MHYQWWNFHFSLFFVLSAK